MLSRFPVELVVFLEGKDEPYSPTSGYTKWRTLLEKSLDVQVYQSHMEDLQPEDLERIPLMIIAGPRRKFSSAEFAALQTFRDRGISLLFLLGEGGQDDLPTNINAFLSQSSTGLSFASDRVLRRAWLKYFHPKQAVINDGLLEDSPLLFLENRLEFIYPFGCTVEVGVAESAIPLLTTGQCCYPTGRPICAMSLPSSVNGGKTLCFGSLFAFHDQFLDKEENTKLLIALMGICLTPSEILRKNYPRMPKAEDIPDRPPRQSIPRLRMRPTPVVENVFRSFSLDAYCEGMKDVAFGDLASQIQLEVEIERVAEELNVSWDSSQAIVVTPLEGYLPDLEFPIFDPEPRIPGEPTLPLLDLDEDLVSWEERLEQLASEADAESRKEDFFQKTAEVMGLPLDSPVGILQLVVRRIFQYDKNNPRRDILEEESAKDGSHLNNQSGEPAKFPDSSERIFNLLSAENYLNWPKNPPISDAEVLKDCLERRSRMRQARAALYNPIERPEAEDPFPDFRSAGISNETSEPNGRQKSATSFLQSDSNNRFSDLSVGRPSSGSPVSLNSEHFSNSSTRMTPPSGRLSRNRREWKINFELYDCSSAFF